MRLEPNRVRPWAYSLLLHVGLVLFMVLSFHWGNSVVPALGGHAPDTEPVKATVVDQHLIDQQLSMLKAEQQKKQQEKRDLEQNLTDLRQQQANAERQMNQQAADMKAQADKLAKLKAEQDALNQKKKTAETLARKRQLQDEIAREERARDSRLASLREQYVALINQKVSNNWIRPPSTPDNLKCVVQVSQVQGGTVTDVDFGSCNGDEVVRESIRTAVYRASPLPAPPDPSLFDKSIRFTFFDKKN